MTEEEVARRWAAKNNMCLIDWKVLEHMRKYTPNSNLIFDARTSTYKLSELGEVLTESTI